jgi:hypothetical protein
MLKSKYSICTAYQSTVQTEQAMSFFKLVGLGQFWQQDYYNTCGTVKCSAGIFYTYFEHSL